LGDELARWWKKKIAHHLLCAVAIPSVAVATSAVVFAAEAALSASPMH
jgi:hypothetical protein